MTTKALMMLMMLLMRLLRLLPLALTVPLSTKY